MKQEELLEQDFLIWGELIEVREDFRRSNNLGAYRGSIDSIAKRLIKELDEILLTDEETLLKDKMLPMRAAEKSRALVSIIKNDEETVGALKGEIATAIESYLASRSIQKSTPTIWADFFKFYSDLGIYGNQTENIATFAIFLQKWEVDQIYAHIQKEYYGDLNEHISYSTFFAKGELTKRLEKLKVDQQLLNKAARMDKVLESDYLEITPSNYFA